MDPYIIVKKIEWTRKVFPDGVPRGCPGDVIALKREGQVEFFRIVSQVTHRFIESEDNHVVTVMTTPPVIIPVDRPRFASRIRVIDFDDSLIDF